MQPFQKKARAILIVMPKWAATAILKELPTVESNISNNCASEASPTPGCSIEISRDIYIYTYVVGMSRMSN